MKIFLSERVIHFTEAIPEALSDTDLLYNYGNGEFSAVWNDFKRYEKYKNLYIVTGDSRSGLADLKSANAPSGAVFDDFCSLFTFIPAAGGLVKNETDEWLFIHRYGHWDLPKGKIGSKDGLIREKRQELQMDGQQEHQSSYLDFFHANKESIRTVSARAAVREVKEETGLREVVVTRELPSTWHIFEKDGQDYLKQTFWFEMQADGSQLLTPQVSEGIFLVKWTSMKGIHCILSHTYASIREMLLEVLF
jgi:8-oxo-dGTP pyrophosphatase MutT (NUDIX family)